MKPVFLLQKGKKHIECVIMRKHFFSLYGEQVIHCFHACPARPWASNKQHLASPDCRAGATMAVEGWGEEGPLDLAS